MELKDALVSFYIDSTLRELRSCNDISIKISHSDLLYLDLIYFNKGCTASYLAGKLNIAKSAVTIRMNRMVRKGWIERIENPDDRREKKLYLTTEMENTYVEFTYLFDEYERKLRESFSEDDIQLFSKMIIALEEDKH